jgi:hypothetical protein
MQAIDVGMDVNDYTEDMYRQTADCGETTSYRGSTSSKSVLPGTASQNDSDNQTHRIPAR